MIYAIVLFISSVSCLIVSVILFSSTSTKNIVNENKSSDYDNIDLSNLLNLNDIKDLYINKLVSIKGISCPLSDSKNSKILLSNFIDHSTDNLGVQYIYEKNQKKSYKYESLPWGICNQNNNITIEINNNLFNKLVGDFKVDFLNHGEFYSQSIGHVSNFSDSITVLGGYNDGGTHQYKKTWYQYIFGLPNDKTHTRLLKSNSLVGIIGLLKYVDGKYVIDENIHFGEIYFGYIDFSINNILNDNVFPKIITVNNDLYFTLAIVLLVLSIILFISIGMFIPNISNYELRYDRLRNNGMIEIPTIRRCDGCHLCTNGNCKCINCDKLTCRRCIYNCMNCDVVICNSCKTDHYTTCNQRPQPNIEKCRHCKNNISSIKKTCSKCNISLCSNCTETCWRCLSVLCKGCWVADDHARKCSIKHSQVSICRSNNCANLITNTDKTCRICLKTRCDSCFDNCIHCRESICESCWIIKDGRKFCPHNLCNQSQTIGCGIRNCESLIRSDSPQCQECNSMRCDRCIEKCIHCLSIVCKGCWVISDNHKICPKIDCLRSQSRDCGCSIQCNSYAVLNNPCSKCTKLRCDNSTSDCIHCRNKICNNCWVIVDGHKICPRNECLRSQSRGCGCSKYCSSYVFLSNTNCKKCYKLRCDDSTSDCIHCRNKICSNCWVYVGGVKTCPIKRCYQSQILCYVCNELVIGENLVDCQSCNKIVCNKCSNNKYLF